MNQWRKDIASWKCGKTLYLSVPFTWLLGKAEEMASGHKGRVVAGGPAVQLVGAEWADETPPSVPFDALAMHNPCATFTTRGCANRCTFCAVPRTEGEFRELSEWKPAPIVCDNNFLVASKKHRGRVVESLRCFPLVDFNQGLEARRFDRTVVEQLAQLQSVKVRFAFDHANAEGPVADAIALALRSGFKNLGVYVLIGYNDTPEDALCRLEKVREWGALPNPMRYQPLDAETKDAYVSAGWTGLELRKMMRYYSRLSWLGHIAYADYQHGDETPDMFDTPKPATASTSDDSATFRRFSANCNEKS